MISPDEARTPDVWLLLHLFSLMLVVFHPLIINSPDYAGCIDRRGIINNYHFEMGICLINHAINRFTQIIGAIIGRDDHAYFWISHIFFNH